MRHYVCFQHGGPPSHYSREMHQCQPENYPRRWAGSEREAPVFWLARSLDMNTIDFFFYEGI
jgi:hypothetical protein